MGNNIKVSEIMMYIPYTEEASKNEGHHPSIYTFQIIYLVVVSYLTMIYF